MATRKGRLAAGKNKAKSSIEPEVVSLIPPLTYEKMIGTICAVLEFQHNKSYHWGAPSSYLSQNSPTSSYGGPSCKACGASFEGATSWAKHMMTKAHSCRQYKSSLKNALLVEKWMKAIRCPLSKPDRESVEEYLKEFFPDCEPA